MHKHGVWGAALIGTAILEASAVRPASGAENNPLLVVVESQSSLGVDAADVRRRIAGELHQAVVSPGDPAAAHAAQVLIVTLDENDIKISMRSGGSVEVSRTIPDVNDRAARLRAVGWLAGNLARDQVGPLLPSLALTPAPKLAVKSTPTASPAGPAPTTTVLPAVEPSSSGPNPAASPDATVTAHAEPDKASAPARWWITASAGATVSDGCLEVDRWPIVTCGATGGGAGSAFVHGSTYQVEVQHRTSDDGTLLGAAIDSGPNSHLVGLGGLIGTRRPWGRWYLEATLGAGIEAQRVSVSTRTVLSSSTEPGPVSNITVSEQVQPALYARATGSIGIPINRTFDFMARLTAHLSSSSTTTDFIGATAGLRLKVP
jgi:hypothetical protein